MARIRHAWVAVGVGAVFLGLGPARGDEPVAPLNGTVSFPSASAQSDTLYVDAGQRTVKATDAKKIQGAANSRITVVTDQGTGQVHVADVILREGDSLYHVNGVYVGGSGGSPATWTADYNRGAARILLEINGTPELSDDYVTYGDNGGTLTITLAGGSSSTTYTVDLSSDPSGRVEFSSTSVTLAGGASTSIALHGRSIGDATINAVEHYSAATSGSVVVHVVGAIIEADVVDRPPTGATYASGIDNSTLVVKLNGNTISPTLTTITDGISIRYEAQLSELVSGTNTVSVAVRDLATNETSPDPVTWTFQRP